MGKNCTFVSLAENVASNKIISPKRLQRILAVSWPKWWVPCRPSSGDGGGRESRGWFLAVDGEWLALWDPENASATGGCEGCECRQTEGRTFHGIPIFHFGDGVWLSCSNSRCCQGPNTHIYIYIYYTRIPCHRTVFLHRVLYVAVLMRISALAFNGMRFMSFNFK